MIDILLVPIGLVMMLVVIHAWFGIGILDRGIIFTDLAIAQFAALGSAISLGYFHEEYYYLWTFSFAFLSALLIAYASQRKVHLEAFIGLLYVIGASGIMMVLAHSAEGMEHFKSLLASDILFTDESQLLQAALIYTLIGLFIWKLYPKVTGFTKDLLFFSLLALTVTSSVQLAGVLVVFSLLIAPALIATTQKRFTPIFAATLFGWSVTTVTIIFAFYMDLPTGYSIVFVLALVTLTLLLLTASKKTVP